MKIAKSAVRKHAKGRFSHFPRGLNRRFSLLIPRQNYSHAPPFVLQRLTSMTLHIASRSTPSPLQDCNDVLIRNKITLNDHMISIHILPLLSTTTNCLDLALRLVEWRGFCAEWLCQGPVFCILPSCICIKLERFYLWRTPTSRHPQESWRLFCLTLILPLPLACNAFVRTKAAYRHDRNETSAWEDWNITCPQNCPRQFSFGGPREGAMPASEGLKTGARRERKEFSGMTVQPCLN